MSDGLIQPVSADIKVIALDSGEGQALLDRKRAVDFQPLMENWVAQLRSHCGAASACVVQNSLQPGAGYTQDGLFTAETAHIITQDVVYRLGFTLEELTEMIKVTSGLKAERFHAGVGDGLHGYDDFIAALKEARSNPDDRLIINYSRKWLRGEGDGGGHFSPIADYNEAANMVLVLEINAGWKIFWINARVLWGSMAAVDEVCGENRGWIVVSK